MSDNQEGMRLPATEEMAAEFLGQKWPGYGRWHMRGPLRLLLDKCEQRGAERERAACEKIARAEYVDTMRVHEAAIGDHEQEIIDETGAVMIVTKRIADAIAARTAPATPGKEDGE